MASESKFAILKEKERETRKQIVIESTLTLFSKKPFYEVGMRDVAEEAGVSPATLYRYFPSQEALFIESFLQNISSVAREFENMIKKDEPATIEEFAIKFTNHLLDNESSFQMMTYLMLKNDLTNPAIGRFDSLTKVFFDMFSSLMERHGVVREDARLFSHSFIASITGIIMTFRNYSFKSREKVKSHINQLVKITASLYTKELLGE
ncbi:MAG: TetR/AcrR family transcriptional regulator [Desulfobacteraceae bacterium]